MINKSRDLCLIVASRQVKRLNFASKKVDKSRDLCLAIVSGRVKGLSFAGMRVDKSRDLCPTAVSSLLCCVESRDLHWLTETLVCAKHSQFGQCKRPKSLIEVANLNCSSGEQ